MCHFYVGDNMTEEKNQDLDPQFEKKLEKLEKIVQELEEGELGLAKSLKKFEEGIDLYKECKNQFVKAEKKISELAENLKENDL